jgi:hypothetical protein
MGSPTASDHPRQVPSSSPFSFLFIYYFLAHSSQFWLGGYVHAFIWRPSPRLTTKGRTTPVTPVPLDPNEPEYEVESIVAYDRVGTSPGSVYWRYSDIRVA